MKAPKPKDAVANLRVWFPILIFPAALVYLLLRKVLDSILPGFWVMVGISLVITVVGLGVKQLQKVAGFAWIATVAILAYNFLKGLADVLVIACVVLAVFVLVGRVFKGSKSESTTARAA